MDDNADVVVRLYEAIPFPCPLKTCGRVQTLNITQPTVEKGLESA